jgi:selenium-binding protein 1
MPIRPDPTFHASPKLAMEAAPENFAYTLLLSPDFSKPDALAVVDVKPGSSTFGQIVHTMTMPYKGDEFHHFGWNACSSALSPLTGHAFLERRYLIIPGLRSSRIYVVDTKPDPTKARIHKGHRARGGLQEDRLLAASYGPLRSGRRLCQHSRRRRQRWHRRAAWHLHHGL